MKKLPNTILTFAPHGGAGSSGARGSYNGTRARTALVCRWRRDPLSGRLHCVWSSKDDESGLDEGARLSLAA
ncbi:hypothetical protein MPC4_350021 [Methylocella tundrae]|uniref:Uncharacterized protein n=1 Tax=Methylocella tundrae TaxID=227605 RepID=A0A8B6M9Y7_METTU|nr:hypothetical protein MPC4_350021 [Methylocella tundrae]